MAKDLGSGVNDLVDLRKQLDAGSLSIEDFLKQGMPLAQDTFKKLYSYGGSGGSQATEAQRMLGLLNDAGWKNQNEGASGDIKILPSLPSQYQQKIRESLLPAGLSEDQKAAYLKEIPQDIEFGSDQFNLEKEGLRQKLQQEQTLGTQKTARQQMLDKLAGVLNTNAENQFKRSIPTIADDANSSGVFRSSGYGNALAKYQNQLQQDTATTLGKASLDSENADINTLADIESNLQGFQTAGLNREFSLEDFAKQKDYELQMAKASQPQPQGKSNGQKWAQGLSLGIPVAAAPFTGGASLAATGKAGGGGGAPNMAANQTARLGY